MSDSSIRVRAPKQGRISRIPKRLPPKVRRSADLDDAIAVVVEERTDRYRLAAPEASVLLESTRRGTSERAVLAKVLRLYPETVKSHVRAVLRRTGSPSLAHAAICIFSEALSECLSERVNPRQGRAL